ncbi:hypothetical protein GGTG_06288 [Gaeumannomyces tritici R3-111a-1]|uniref:Uncharacterized protein n=1 Tax=Gaeumannomyces tritici (strain R3-111a-1) TaxID=644352 RepID=J3NYD5_GAET3|nr:hypothetical protein GGTG_06288 [Gaeumannomyces tritici R3-111a-1]EJT76368.1 hypothetical protein GGTG_06288 [Gaeumannomyces tritici R3-111a-1]
MAGVANWPRPLGRPRPAGRQLGKAAASRAGSVGRAMERESEGERRERERDAG